jgi:polysaccharide biosynthesis protein PslH
MGSFQRKLLSNSLLVEASSTTDRTPAKKEICTLWNIPLANKILLFTCSGNYTPNQDAVINIHRFLLPQLKLLNTPFTIIITGNIAQELKSEPEVIYTGYVPNLHPYYCAADTFINPVLIGGGVQTKNLVALATGLPTVCFEHMQAGLYTPLTNKLVQPIPINNWNLFAELALASKPALMPSAEWFALHDKKRNLHLLEQQLKR